jgi:putative membrane protein
MGLLDTRTVHRDDQRIRGLTFDEPLIWRWLRLTETHLVTTGLGAAGSPGGAVLPRIPLPEARSLAARILTDGHRPWEAPLRRHPRGALTSRLLTAVGESAAVAAILWVYDRTGAISDGWWPFGFALMAVTVPLAVVDYRALGHATAGPYVVLRSGVFTRRTVALQRRAIAGWTVQQSIFQRWGGRATVGVATAAGSRFYEVPDAGLDQALALVAAATPELACHFLVADRPIPGSQP